MSPFQRMKAAANAASTELRGGGSPAPGGAPHPGHTPPPGAAGRGGPIGTPPSWMAGGGATPPPAPPGPPPPAPGDDPGAPQGAPGWDGRLLPAFRAHYAETLQPVYAIAGVFVGGMVVHGSGMAAIWPLLAAAPAGAAAYIYASTTLTRRARDRGDILAGQTAGPIVETITAQAREDGRAAAVGSLWLAGVAVTDPANLLGQLWWGGGVLVVGPRLFRDRWQRAARRRAARIRRPEDTLRGRSAAAQVTHEPPQPELFEELRSRMSAAAGGAGAGVDDRTDEEPGYQLPTTRLSKGSPRMATDPACDRIVHEVQRVLDDAKNVEARVTDYVRGPSVTVYLIEPRRGTSPDAILKLKNSLRLYTRAEVMRVILPAQGRSAIGLEIPNENRDLVTLGDVIGQIRGADPLLFVVGVQLDGTPLVESLARMPHMLVGGETGGGKSEFIHNVACTLLMRATPQQVQFVMIDLKKVELACYQGIPHLARPICTTVRAAVNALEWVKAEMQQRYEVMADAGVRTLDELNRKILSGEYRPGGATLQPYPKLVVITDEFAELMQEAKSEVETLYKSIGALARAAGIHKISATQSPKNEVITTTITNNLPYRVAFRVTKRHASDVILGVSGAEELAGQGDALVKGTSTPLTRVQTPLVTTDEIAAIVEHCQAQAAAGETNLPDQGLLHRPTPPPAYWAAGHPGGAPRGGSGSPSRQDQHDPAGATRPAPGAPQGDTPGDDLTAEDYVDVVEKIVHAQLASTGIVQRTLRVPLPVAVHVLDVLADRGVVTSGEGAREVLTTTADLDAVLADLRDNPPGAAPGAAPGGPGRAPTAVEHVWQAITHNVTVGVQFNKTQLRAWTSGLPEPTRNKALADLVGEGAIERVSNGLYVRRADRR